MASIASSARFCCFITIAMSFRALSTLSPALMAAQKRGIAFSGSLSTNCSNKKQQKEKDPIIRKQERKIRFTNPETKTTKKRETLQSEYKSKQEKQDFLPIWRQPRIKAANKRNAHQKTQIKARKNTIFNQFEENIEACLDVLGSDIRTVANRDLVGDVEGIGTSSWNPKRLGWWGRSGLCGSETRGSVPHILQHLRF